MAAAPSPLPPAFHPTSSSWLNLFERWFAELINRKPRRCAHRSVAELEADVRGWINEGSEDPSPSSGPGARLNLGSPLSDWDGAFGDAAKLWAVDGKRPELDSAVAVDS